MRQLMLFIVLSILLSSCSMLTPFHSARTEGKGNLTMAPTIDATTYTGTLLGSSESIYAIPGVRLELAYGLTERLDFLAAVNSSAALKFNFKYRVQGSNDSEIAVAFMPGYEFQTNLNSNLEHSVHRIHIPITLSYLIAPKIDLYFGPNYILQIQKDYELYHYSGMNFGFEFNRPKLKYHVGFGVYLPNANDNIHDGYLIQFGGGLRIPLNR